MSKYAHLIPQLNQLAIEAGAIIMPYYKGECEIEIKEDNSPVTEADIAANAYIVAALQQFAPEVQIVSEEGKQNPVTKDQDFWLVDPLDGTKSFIKQTGEFTVNIALIEAGEPTLGVIYVPVREELYFTGEDGSAYKQAKNAASQQISTRNVPESGMIVVASQSHRTQETDDFINGLENVDTLISASSSLKLCLVAEGAADVYPRFGPTMEWDIAAGHAILRAAGGHLRNPDHSVFEYAKPTFLNGHFIAWGRLAG